MTPERREIMDVFLRDAGWGAANVAPLSGDASTRRYARLMLNDRSAMLMDQPQNAEAPQCPPGATPEQRRVLGYNAIARLAGGDCRRFIATDFGQALDHVRFCKFRLFLIIHGKIFHDEVGHRLGNQPQFALSTYSRDLFQERESEQAATK